MYVKLLIIEILMTKEECCMPEGFSILAELTSAVIGTITGMLAEHGKSSVMQK